MSAGVFTLLVLLTSLLHLDRFHLRAAASTSASATTGGGLPVFFAIVWLAVYIGLPPAMLLAWWWQQRTPGIGMGTDLDAAGASYPLPARLRQCALLLVAVLGASGVVLFVAPAVAAPQRRWRDPPG